MIEPLTLSRACVANLPTRKPICANACGLIFVYFASTASISRVSGPTVGSRRLNSWPMNILLSNSGNAFAIELSAIGVVEPQITLSTAPCAIAAFMRRARCRA